jgi:hypothetical protein
VPLAHRVLAQIDVPLHGLGRGAGGLDSPIGITTKRNPALTPVDAIVENKRLRAPWGDAERETFDLAIPYEALAARRRQGLSHDRVGELLDQGPLRVNTVSTDLVAFSVAARRGYVGARRE